MKKIRYVILFFIIFILFSILSYISGKSSLFEGMMPSRQIDVSAFIGDSTISDDTKIQMINLLKLGDSRVVSILNDATKSNKLKVTGLKTLLLQ